MAGHMEMVKHLQGRVLLAVPKKGRLNESALDLLEGSSIKFRRKDRVDIALVTNLDIALVFLPAADIPTFVGEGRVDLGITGRDQVREHEAAVPPTATTGVEEVLDLGFGKCRLQVQVPEEGGIQDAKDLVGKNVATSFVNLTRQYFAKLEGIEDVNGGGPGTELRTHIKLLGGSVETACTLGVADGIVDLVESGETMKAAGLKPIASVVDSTAVLIKSKHPTNVALVNLIVSRIEGFVTARKYVLCQYNIPRSALETATHITPGKRAPTINALEKAGWVAVSSMVEKKRIAAVMDELIKIGAEDILELAIANTRLGG
ncbi:MAG: ATP phosphoribosyltransferase (ATP-PRTase) (ATP-PRT) [Thelocarpon impressellum]|nr:MAG: ATP phosphoribosyltransferase (ATP-PRTase) (ATP-PRT) [Thelocarpon impressellum]